MSTVKDADKHLVKLLLEVIEGKDLQRNKVHGLDNIFKSPDCSCFFPQSKRQALRKKWDDLRRLKVENYYKTLEELEVTPGAGTQRELFAAERQRRAQAQAPVIGSSDEHSTIQGTSSDDDSNESKNHSKTLTWITIQPPPET